MTPAGYGARIAAALLDLVIVSVGTTVLAWPFLKMMNFEQRLQDLNAIVAQAALHPDDLQIDPAMIQSMFSFMIGLLLLTLVLLLAMHTYYIWFESSPSGQTPGKKALGLRVVDLEGKPITRTQAVYREVLRWYVDGLFLFPAFIAMALTPRRQRVGDIAAKTMVVEVSARRT